MNGQVEWRRRYKCCKTHGDNVGEQRGGDSLLRMLYGDLLLQVVAKKPKILLHDDTMLHLGSSVCYQCYQ